ncbi:BQ2448_1533 [Microbotryum intermedium]|uniref:[RNA-polymerase]-subunit kinase n=1 Tax=Microbotryum intermedium TaxID=269621 RepID=A0A238FBH4_9BASI|nr:BQ2448_1533 [Microbotryum intermedium]
MSGTRPWAGAAIQCSSPPASASATTPGGPSVSIRGAAALLKSSTSSASSAITLPVASDAATTGSTPTTEGGAGREAPALKRLVGGFKSRAVVQFSFKGRTDPAATKASAYGTRNVSSNIPTADKPVQAGNNKQFTPPSTPETGELAFASSSSPRKKLTNSLWKAAVREDLLISPDYHKARQLLYEESLGHGQGHSPSQSGTAPSQATASTSAAVAPSIDVGRSIGARYESGKRPITPEPLDESGREEGELEDAESFSLAGSSRRSQTSRGWNKEDSYRRSSEDRDRSDRRPPSHHEYSSTTARRDLIESAPRHSTKDSSRRRSHGSHGARELYETHDARRSYLQHNDRAEDSDGRFRPSRSPRAWHEERRRSRSHDDDRRKRPRDDDRDEHGPSSKRMSSGGRRSSQSSAKEGVSRRHHHDDRDDHSPSAQRRQPSRSPRSPSRSRSRSPRPRIYSDLNKGLGPTQLTGTSHPKHLASPKVPKPDSPTLHGQGHFSNLPIPRGDRYDETVGRHVIEAQANENDVPTGVVASPSPRSRPGAPLRPSNVNSPGLEADSERGAPPITTNEVAPASNSPPSLASSTKLFADKTEPVHPGGRRSHVRDTELWLRDETNADVDDWDVYDEQAPDANIGLVGSSSIDAYQLQRKLGEGTFGVVSLGTRGKGEFSEGEKRREEALLARGLKVRHGDCVALKKIILHNESDGMPITSLREIRILKALNHSAIVPLVDMAYENGKHSGDPAQYKLGSTCMVFPYMDHDLAGLLENPRVKLEVWHIKQYAKQLLEGTDYLHENGLLHRDMKAANLLINNKGDLMIADFGLARSVRKEANSRGYTNCVVTRWYRPPELLLGQTKYHTAVDMWGVGCVMAEMFHKRPIFPGDSDTNQIALIAKWCGAPSEQSMPGFKELPGCEGVKEFTGPANNDEIRNRAIKWEAGETFGDLLAQILVLDPDQRLTARQALDHDWFWTEPYPAERSAIPQWESSHEMDKRQREEQQQRQDRRYRAPAPVTAPRQNGGHVPAVGGRGAHAPRPHLSQAPVRQHQPMQVPAPHYDTYLSRGPSWTQSAHSAQHRPNGNAPATAAKAKVSIADMMKR